MESPYQPSEAAAGDAYLQLTERLVARGCHHISVDDVRSAWAVLDNLLADRVGARMSIGMTESELDEFHSLVDSEPDGNGEDAGTRWLRLHAPGFQAVVHHEIAALTHEAADWFARHYPTTSAKERPSDQAA